MQTSLRRSVVLTMFVVTIAPAPIGPSRAGRLRRETVRTSSGRRPANGDGGEPHQCQIEVVQSHLPRIILLTIVSLLESKYLTFPRARGCSRVYHQFRSEGKRFLGDFHPECGKLRVRPQPGPSRSVCSIILPLTLKFPHHVLAEDGMLRNGDSLEDRVASLAAVELHPGVPWAQSVPVGQPVFRTGSAGRLPGRDLSLPAADHATPTALT